MSGTRTIQSCSRLLQWQALLLLLVFLSARGLVPAGFMPAAFTAGTPYGLCHGDSRTALLLNALASNAHSNHHNSHTNPATNHNHDALTAHSFADNHCNFSAVASISSSAATELDIALSGFIYSPSLAGFHPALSSPYNRPLIRAPPA
ncbi:hypothetical protein MO867_00215 [Microbulbifer sp. OS29]|uniref:DUF2946 domain-containing protein n=1 Tax=Microbulbifer okhotskensis TaxID=2926617 RepID=A0A9X2ENC7_9GAMM|nr:hypothetical protein [Microbulbifer okhotskensis]MCO1332748.1 hypothetical protein [Microbulbifer okhotskensis]